MADLRFGSLVTEVSGEGPPVVLVHGLGGSSNSFQPLMTVLDGRKAVRPDLPGAGRSGLRPGRLGLEGLTAAVLEQLRALGVARAHLVGHSMGTLICQELAARHPGLVSGLTLFGPILEPPPPARAALKVRADDARRNGMSAIADAIVRGSLAAATRERKPAVVAFVRESLMRQDPGGYARHCEALAEMTPPDHAGIGCPTQLITGNEDAVAPPAMAQKLAGLISNAHVEILPDCGHWTMLEAPEHSIRLLRAQLEHNMT